MAPDFTAVTELPGSLLNWEQMARIRQRYALAASLARGARVLEISCGSGIGLGLVQEAATSLVGCDLTYGVLAAAQQHYGGRIPLVGADAQRLPFADYSFDLLLCFEAIYYLPHPDHFLNEARRLLSPRGRLLIGTSNPHWPHFVPGAMSLHYPDLGELDTRLRQAGFAQLQAWGSFPADDALPGRQTLVSTARRQLGRLPFLTADTGLTRLLKRLAYGRLTPLPAELPGVAESEPSPDLTPLDPNQPDRRHRVLFVLAQV
jgi:ubiquinone/menaquinone biosynthesis C-methylase UbiE